jgi:hypothetical protein
MCGWPSKKPSTDNWFQIKRLPGSSIGLPDTTPYVTSLPLGLRRWSSRPAGAADDVERQSNVQSLKSRLNRADLLVVDRHDLAPALLDSFDVLSAAHQPNGSHASPSSQRGQPLCEA